MATLTTTDLDRIPNLVIGDLGLLSYNIKLQSLRQDLQLIVSKVISGAYGAKRAFGNILDEIFYVIEKTRTRIETLVIPKEKFDDFLNAIVTFDEYAEFDILEYYKGLYQLKLSFYMMKSMLHQIQDIPTKSLNPMPESGVTDGLLDSLRDIEFLGQGYDNPVIEIEQNYFYYTIMENDTLQSIAVKVFEGDASRWPEIARINSISDTDLLDNDMVGVTIKIPTETGGLTRADDNLVYEPLFDGTSQTDIDTYLHGQDLALDINYSLLSDSLDDLKTISGIQTVVANIEDRFRLNIGDLNPIHPDWGMGRSMSEDKPYLILLDRLIREMEDQAMADPRVISASADRNTIVITGDRLDIEMTIDLIGGSTEKTTLGIPTS